MKDCCRKYLEGQFGGDEVVSEIYREYVASAKEKLSEAEGELAAGEWVRLDRTAHAVKGNALSVGDQEMADAAVALRKAAALNDAWECAAQLARMRELSAAL